MAKFPDLRTHMKLRYFRLVETLASTKSIRLAAERLNITPAAVSKSCRELESILGVQLFARTASGFLPTPLCERFMISGRRIDGELKNLMSDFTLLEESFHDNVKIGFQTPMLQETIARSVGKLKKEHPSLNLTLEYAARHYLLSGLQANLYDFIFVNLSDLTAHPRLNTKKLASEQYVVASMTSIHSVPDVLDRWDEFASATWVIPVPGMAMRDRFDSILAARGLRLPPRRIEINSPLGSKKLVDISDAFTFLPLSMLKSLGREVVDPDTHLRFLPELHLESGMVWLRDTHLSPAAQYASDFISEKILRLFSKK
ncbi:regulatory protein, LysR:LysR, substrate-binding [Acetobacter malorum]|uniref:Regulatory protein, LysR:LysR, substrate-binding n=1 Tax=Acetobacter malorum TaxID=178901 RepID=A0A177G6I5_9PROT|nr:LysR family transcriptional regulator [Acetobacter malorum]OAG75446.1 regulatory protein, LysR:LysR, substrate-binding [Acetobacter malorum]